MTTMVLRCCLALEEGRGHQLEVGKFGGGHHRGLTGDWHRKLILSWLGFFILFFFMLLFSA